MWVNKGGCAQNHAVDSEREITFNGDEVPDSPAHLYRDGGFPHDRLDRFPVLRNALPGAIQVNQVEEFSPLPDPPISHGHRIFPIHSLSPIITLEEPHALSPPNLN